MSLNVMEIVRCAMGIRVYDYSLLQKVKDKNGLCLCTVDDVKCICEEFKNQEEGICHCKVYIKIKEEK